MENKVEDKAMVLVLIALSLIGVLAVYSVDPCEERDGEKAYLVDKLSGT